ncbi:YraN family protein [Nonomuraea glycinis]|jgi:putative endonuclease|uniref:YraN family protein n=1 Tax=Nonomuraea glycinis TaxID=2047744 RepID=UPI002E160624|nr:YraN family protein [Nonomuraea glycinis]
MAARNELGRHGEQLAAAYLQAEGMTIIERNWRCRYGEIDIIAEDGPSLVVVEVKTRSSSSHGTALESVRPAKVARLRVLAARWLAGQPRVFAGVRVDVIALERFAGDFSLRHVRGAS